MSHCGVFDCSVNSNHKDKIKLLQKPIVIDDYGSVLDGLDVKLFSLPSVPNASLDLPQAKLLRQKWIHLLCRSDRLPKNPKNIKVCSRHFARDSYNTMVLIREKKNSFLEVARSSPRAMLLLPNAVPTMNLPKMKDPIVTSREERMEVKARKEIVNLAMK
jgi:THAP domain